MLRPRVIPVLLLKGRGLYKTVEFGEPKYVGDPVNTVRIFNEKEVDEICVLDISATHEKRGPNIDVIREIASECFMPLSYGGGVTSLEQAKALFNCGVEKVVVNHLAHLQPQTVKTIAEYAGSSSVVVSIDVRKRLLRGYEACVLSGKVGIKKDPVAYAKELAALGVGEILLNSIDRDGTMQGYDLALIEAVAGAVDIPVIACGGAASMEHFAGALRSGASAVAAGSYFVFQGKHRAVLISYPKPDEIEQLPTH